MVGCLHERANGSSWDGFQARKFHSSCVAKGPTVTIVKSENYILEGSLRYRGTVSMLVVTWLNNDIFGHIYRRWLYILG